MFIEPSKVTIATAVPTKPASELRKENPCPGPLPASEMQTRPVDDVQDALAQAVLARLAVGVPLAPSK